jgi:hypothetical protein
MARVTASHPNSATRLAEHADYYRNAKAGSAAALAASSWSELLSYAIYKKLHATAARTNVDVKTLAIDK